MSDTRSKDVNWLLHRDTQNRLHWKQIHTALLMDLRDELKRLNALLHCSNFVEIPRILRGIRRNTTKPKPKPKAAKKRGKR